MTIAIVHQPGPCTFGSRYINDMKTIISPVNFSKSSVNAAEYAADLNKHDGGIEVEQFIKKLTGKEKVLYPANKVS